MIFRASESLRPPDSRALSRHGDDETELPRLRLTSRTDGPDDLPHTSHLAEYARLPHGGRRVGVRDRDSSVGLADPSPALRERGGGEG